MSILVFPLTKWLIQKVKLLYVFLFSKQYSTSWLYQNSMAATHQNVYILCQIFCWNSHDGYCSVLIVTHMLTASSASVSSDRKALYKSVIIIIIIITCSQCCCHHTHITDNTFWWRHHCLQSMALFSDDIAVALHYLSLLSSFSLMCSMDRLTAGRYNF